MKKLIKKIFQIKKKAKPLMTKTELEKKAIEGAKKAVKEYRRVFERLAEYDRT